MTVAAIERHPVADRLHAISAEMNAFYKEREDPILAMLYAILSREHVFMLGPPGVAKSELVRYLVRAITGVRYFETAMSRNKPAEKVIGHTNIKELRENNRLVTERKGYITDAELVFVDEVGKMSAILGHDLLALLNERVYHEVADGLSVHEAPLMTAFTASNEQITDQSDEAAALDDRLLLRVFVDSVQGEDNFKSILVAPKPVNATFVSLTELEEAQRAVQEVSLDGVLDGVAKLKAKLKVKGIEPSTRRWRQSMAVVRSSAFLAGRTTAIDSDLAALRFVLWMTADQIEPVTHACLAASDPWVEPLAEIRQIVSDIDTGISERLSDGSDETARSTYAHDAEHKLGVARDRLDTMLIDASDRQITGFKAVSDFHRATLRRNMRDLMGQFDEAILAQLLSTRCGQGDGGQS